MPPYRTIPSPEEPIGRVMDKLYQLDVSGIFLLISLAAVKKFGVATENCHLDSTSLSVEGEYIAIPIVVRYRVLGFEESGVKILVYLMRLGNAIFNSTQLLN